MARLLLVIYKTTIKYIVYKRSSRNTFTERSYNAAGDIEFTTSKKLMYIDELTHERHKEAPLLFKRGNFPFNYTLYGTSFPKVIYEMVQKRIDEYLWYPLLRWHNEELIKSERFVNLRGYDHNVAFLNEMKLFNLGLITNEEVNTILAAKTPPVHELLSAVVPTTDEFECAICLERSVEGLVWHSKKCHIFHCV